MAKIVIRKRFVGTLTKRTTAKLAQDYLGHTCAVLVCEYANGRQFLHIKVLKSNEPIYSITTTHIKDLDWKQDQTECWFKTANSQYYFSKVKLYEKEEA